MCAARKTESLVAFESNVDSVCVAMNDKHIITALQNDNLKNSLIIWNRLTLKTERVTIFLYASVKE